MNRKFWSAILLGTVFSCFALAENAPVPSPEKWLEGMTEATRNLTYRGHFVYQQGVTLETLAVTHTNVVVDNAVEERERIVYQDGLPREMVRQGKNIVFATAGREPSVFQQASLMPMVGRFAGGDFSSNYQIKPAAIDRVAGREAVQLLVVPKDRYRHGYQLWLDRKTGLMLKSVMVDSEGRIMERMQFTDLDVIKQLTDDEMKYLSRDLPPAEKSDVVHADSGKTESTKRDWIAGWIPDGFTAQSQSRRDSPVSRKKVDAENYSDGLASFSVFVEPDETKVLSQATEQIGAIAAVSKVFRSGNNYFHVTVVGEIPLGTAERIAVSVRPREKEAE